jgi:hypothetical protein
VAVWSKYLAEAKSGAVWSKHSDAAKSVEKSGLGAGWWERFFVGTRRASPKAKRVFRCRRAEAARSKWREGGLGDPYGRRSSGGLAIVVVQHPAQALAAFDLAARSADFGA